MRDLVDLCRKLREDEKLLEVLVINIMDVLRHCDHQQDDSLSKNVRICPNTSLGRGSTYLGGGGGS